MKSEIHVRLSDSKNKRLIILNSAKFFTHELRNYQIYKIRREEKQRKLNRLMAVFGEIKTSFNKLSLKNMPALQVVDKEIPVKEIKRKIVEENKPSHEKLIMPKQDELSRELDEIDRKLRML